MYERIRDEGHSIAVEFRSVGKNCSYVIAYDSLRDAMKARELSAYPSPLLCRRAARFQTAQSARPATLS